MKKSLLVTLVLVIFCMLAACGSSGDNAQEKSSVSVADVVEKIRSVNPVAEEREIDDFALENEMGLDPESIEEYKGVITNSQNDCALIFVAKVKDGKVKEVKKALSDYLDSLSANDLYAEFADKIAKTKEARVLIFDDYAVLAIAGLNAENDEVIKAANEAFGK